MSKNQIFEDMDLSHVKATDLLNLVADGYFVISSDKKISYWSSGMQELFGLSAEDAYSGSCHQIIHGGNPAYEGYNCYCPLAQVTRDVKVSQIETSVIGKGGREVPILATHVLVEGPGKKVLVIVENLTDRRNLMEQQKELLAAQKIHAHFLPETVPEIDSLDLGVAYIPANVIGGDFYNFIVDKDGLRFYLGDVAGRGIPAALSVSLVTHVIRSEMFMDPELLSLPLESLNRILCRQLNDPLFVSAVVANYDVKEHSLHFINAGHCPPLILRGKGDKAFYTEYRNSALGINESANFEKSVIRLFDDDIIVFYTDGIIESRNPARQQFGEERLTAMIEDYRQLPAQTIADLVSAAVTDFCAYGDDMTLIIAKALKNPNIV